MKSADRLQLAFLMLIVAAASAITHWPALSANAIIFDDDMYLADNDLVRTPSWNSTRRFFMEVLEPSTVAGYYQPLAMVSTMLDCALGGAPGNLRPFHVTSLIIHVLNSMLVCALIHTLIANRLAALVAGLFYGVHPLGTDSVVWIAERKSLLAIFFALLCLLAFIRHARSVDSRRAGVKAASNGSMATRWLFVSLSCFVLSVLSKPTTVPLPILLILLDLWPLERFSGRALVEKLPFFAVATVSAIITVISQARTAFIIRPEDQSPLRIPLTVCHNIVFYLRKMILPNDMSCFYDYPRPFAISNPSVLIGVIGTFLLAIAVVAFLRRFRAISVGVGIYLFAISPTLGIIGFTQAIAADRFAHFPMIGILLILAAFIAIWTGKSSSRLRGATVLIVGITCSACLAYETRRYLVHWQTSEACHKHMLALAPDAAPIHASLGYEYQKQNRYSDAIPYFNRALALDPTFLVAHINLGQCFEMIGNTDEAATHYRAALNDRRNGYMAHNNLALQFAARGRIDDAIAHLKDSVNLRPSFVEGRVNLGLLLMEKGQLQDAVVQCREAVRQSPGHCVARADLAIVLMNIGQLNDALTEFRTSISCNPEMFHARFNLGCLYQRLGRMPEAAAEFREAVRLNPQDSDAQRLFRETQAERVSR